MNAPTRDLALVIGASGGIGSALTAQLLANEKFSAVLGLSRQSLPALDYSNEQSVCGAAQYAADYIAANSLTLRLLIVATGILQSAAPPATSDAARQQGGEPERTWAQLDPQYLRDVFALNAIGPALVVKHFFPLLARRGRCVAAALSAKVGSIGDNRLGGWYGYRASKAALNQFMHTAAIELTRRNRESICVVLHPGTVDTALSKPFAKTGLNVRDAQQAAADLLGVIENLTSADTGGFFDYRGEPLPW